MHSEEAKITDLVGDRTPTNKRKNQNGMKKVIADSRKGREREMICSLLLDLFFDK
jgi:hypothetical protein